MDFARSLDEPLAGPFPIPRIPLVSFTVFFRDRRIGVLHADLHPAHQLATGYFQPEGDVDAAEIGRGLVSLQSFDHELSASNVWLKLSDDRGAFAADAEIRNANFWTAARNHS